MFRMFRLRVLIVFSVLAVFLALNVDGATAEKPQTKPSDPCAVAVEDQAVVVACLSVTADRGQRESSTSTTLIGSQSNPYGCYGATDRPHKSTHAPGQVNVVARTVCAVSVPQIYVETQLYKRNCFLIFCWWDPYGSLGTNLRSNSTLARANSSGTCTTGDYQGRSYHYIIGADGKRYEAWTQNLARVTC